MRGEEQRHSMKLDLQHDQTKFETKTHYKYIEIESEEWPVIKSTKQHPNTQERMLKNTTFLWHYNFVTFFLQIWVW